MKNVFLFKLVKKSFICGAMLCMLFGVNYNTYANSNEKVVYEDEYGLKIVEVSRVDRFVRKDDKNAASTQLTGTRAAYSSSDYRGDASIIATFKNGNSPVENSFDYSNEHSWSNKSTVSGKVDFKVVQATTGVEWKDEYVTTITYHITVPAGKNVNLWTAPTGKKYTYTVYDTGLFGDEREIGHGSYTNFTSTIVTPMYF